MRSSDGRWEIRYEVRDRDSLVECYRSESWHVYHLPSGDEVEIFGRSSVSNSSGSSDYGAADVTFAGDSAVLVTDVDGTQRRVELVWPKPPPPFPSEVRIPGLDIEAIHRRLQAEYEEKLARKDEIERAWQERSKRS
jgi:hypothetical protein